VPEKVRKSAGKSFKKCREKLEKVPEKVRKSAGKS